MQQAIGGIYLHIPFCRQACVYCDFHFLTSLGGKTAMVEALVKELELRKDFFESAAPLSTVYFGGGTPSVLSAEELQLLLVTIREHFQLDPKAEITLEANPDDLNPAYLEALLKAGINRLSIGIQSFREKDLRWMNRSHTSQQAFMCVSKAAKAGFQNISIDLIFGLPGSDMHSWQEQLQTAISLPIQHLSLYALTVEDKTALAHQVKKGQSQIPDDPLFTAQFLQAHERLEQAGFEHYELSNYARPAYRSRHNSAYWQGLPYLGLGPSAHSYDGSQRSWNLSHNQRYLKALQAGKLAIEETEVLSPDDRYHEYIMTQLRKKEGIDLLHIEKNWVSDWKQRFGPYVAELIAKGLMYRKGDHLTLSPGGWMLSDEIIRELFL